MLEEKGLDRASGCGTSGFALVASPGPVVYSSRVHEDGEVGWDPR